MNENCSCPTQSVEINLVMVQSSGWRPEGCQGFLRSVEVYSSSPSSTKFSVKVGIVSSRLEKSHSTITDWNLMS